MAAGRLILEGARAFGQGLERGLDKQQENLKAEKERLKKAESLQRFLQSDPELAQSLNLNPETASVDDFELASNVLKFKTNMERQQLATDLANLEIDRLRSNIASEEASGDLLRRSMGIVPVKQDRDAILFGSLSQPQQAPIDIGREIELAEQIQAFETPIEPVQAPKLRTETREVIDAPKQVIDAANELKKSFDKSREKGKKGKKSIISMDFDELMQEASDFIADDKHRGRTGNRAVLKRFADQISFERSTDPDEQREISNRIFTDAVEKGVLPKRTEKVTIDDRPLMMRPELVPSARRELPEGLFSTQQPAQEQPQFATTTVQDTVLKNAVDAAGGTANFFAQNPDLLANMSPEDIKNTFKSIQERTEGKVLSTKEQLQVAEIAQRMRIADERNLREAKKLSMELFESDKALKDEYDKTIREGIDEAIKFDNIEDTIDEIIRVQNDAIFPAAGKFGQMVIANIPVSTNASDLEKLNKTLKADAAFTELRKIKASGATLGQVSERELQLLESATEALDPLLSADRYIANLENYRRLRRRSIESAVKDIQAKGLQVPPSLLDAIKGSRQSSGPRVISVTPR